MTEVSEWRLPHGLWIVGHRGSPQRARENTLDSLDWAEAQGVDAVEFDVRQTLDGEAIVFHDEEIPIGSEQVPVRRIASVEVRKLLLDSEFGEYRIPTLEQVFHRYGTRLRYLVELKISRDINVPQLARRVVALIENFRLASRCLVASFDADILRKIRELSPGLANSFLVDRPVALPSPGAPTPLFPPCDALGPRQDLVTAELMENAARAGLSVHPWTADDPERMKQLANLGVASITTNVPEMARKVLG